MAAEARSEISAAGRRRRLVGSAAGEDGERSRRSAAIDEWTWEYADEATIWTVDCSFLAARPALGRTLLSACMDMSGSIFGSGGSAKVVMKRLRLLYVMLDQNGEHGARKRPRVQALADVSPAVLADVQAFINARTRPDGQRIKQGTRYRTKNGIHLHPYDVHMSVEALVGSLMPPSLVFRRVGKIGGRARSEAKKAAARANGAKGGRPRKVAAS
jgi:hypothetical protein